MEEWCYIIAFMEGTKMKDYQDLIGKVILAAAILAAALIIAHAIDSAGSNIGSMIGSALSGMGSQIN